jgi:hypothetical protein
VKILKDRCAFWLEPGDESSPGITPMFHLEARNMRDDPVKNVQFMMDAMTESGLLYAFASSDFWKEGDAIQSGGDYIVEVRSDHGPINTLDRPTETLIVGFELSYVTSKGDFTRVSCEKRYDF